jgi:hypothetical protein
VAIWGPVKSQRQHKREKERYPCPHAGQALDDVQLGEIAGGRVEVWPVADSLYFSDDEVPIPRLHVTVPPQPSARAAATSLADSDLEVLIT